MTSELKQQEATPPKTQQDADELEQLQQKFIFENIDLGINDREMQGLISLMMAFDPDQNKLNNEESSEDDEDLFQGLSTLCSLQHHSQTTAGKGSAEKVYRLTELFQPNEYDERIRQKMESYNKYKMPVFRQLISHEDLDKKRRNIKADMKKTVEKLSRSEMPSIMMNDLDYMRKLKVNSEQAKATGAIKFQNNPNIEEIQEYVKPQKPPKQALVGQKRKKQVDFEAIVKSVEDDLKKDSSEKIQLKQKSFLLQQVEQNLEEIKMIEDYSRSDAEKAKELQQITIDQKMIEIQDKISKMECESVLGQLSREEKDIIKISFKKDLNHQLNQAYPALITINETEKKCYEFTSQLVFDDYTTIEQRGSSGNKVFHQSNKKSLNFEDYKLKTDIYSIIGSRRKNQQEEQPLLSIDYECPDHIYQKEKPKGKLQRDSMIRNKMTETKFEQNKLQRKKYWGEPKDCDSQGQINRDFYRFKPKQDQEKLKYFESDQFSNFKTKYGGLNLCEAHPNNFKIDDIDEYEFVMRQRAYLYDPLYIKASNQFKNFSTQVGTGSFRRQFISKDGQLVKSKMKIQKTFDKTIAQSNLYIHKPKQVQNGVDNKLESSSQMQNILKMLNIDLGDGTDKSQEPIDIDPPIQKNAGVDKLKQKQLKIEQQLKDTFDDVENLTNKVNIRKKKEYTKKQSEENKKNEQLNKKIVSTAYRSPTLPTMKPENHGRNNSHKSDRQMSEGGESNYTWNSQGEKIYYKKDESNDFSSDYSGRNPLNPILDVEDVDDSFSDDIDVPEDFLDSSRIQEASHAECIQKLQYNKFYWDLYKGIDELIHFHRPNIQNYFKKEDYSKDPFAKYQLQIIDRETIKNKDKKRGNFKASKHFNDKKKLALKDGKFCIFEHIDENPIFVNNFGMVSKLVRYLYSERELPKQDYLNKHLNQKRKHMGPYGKQHLLGNKQKPPLLGNIDIKTFQGISVLQNELYNAPVFFHKPKQTDFFCSYRILEKNKKEGSETESRKIILREIQSIFSVGQIEPKKPVFNPQSRNYQTFIKQHSKAYILRFLEEVQDERGQNGQIEFRDVQELFRLSDQNLKKFFKEIHVEVGRDQKCSITKPLSHETKINLISPEMICQYESAKYGEAMLMQRGIEKIINSDKISYASNKYCSEQKESLRQQISKFIENEVLCTPWNLSHNFCAHGTGGGMLMLQGVGDPSNDHGGYSFLKMPLKISSDCFRDCMQIRMQQNPAMQNPKSVTGTNADLRKLKKNDIFDKLVQMGYDQNVLRQQSRWQMVGTLRHRSSTSNVQNDNNKIYARGIRYTAKTQQEVYKKRVDKIFKTQMLYMTNKKYLNNDSDDEDPCKQFKIGENASKHQNLDDSDDEYYSNDHQRNIIEIAEEKLITQLQLIDPSDERQFPKVIYCGKIKKIQDIPNYKKLLIKKLQTHNQQNIQGQNDQQSGGIINIGGNSGNHQQDALMNSKNAEQQLDENLNKGDFEFDCEILKKVIRNEDNPEFIERIEFSCDEKVNRKFEKRQAKYKIKIERQNKTSIRDKIMQDQRVQKQRQGGDFQNRQSPEANPKEVSATMSQSHQTMVEDNSNVIKLSLFGGEPQKTNTTAAKTNNKSIGLGQIKGQDLNKFMQPPPLKKPRGATSSRKGGGGSRSTSQYQEQNNNVLKITAAGGSKLQEKQIVEPQIVQLQPLDQQFLMPQNYLTEPIKQNFISIPIMMGGQQASFQVAPEPQQQPSPKFAEKPKGFLQQEQIAIQRAPKKEQKPKKESTYNQSRDHQIIASLQQEQEATRRTSAMLQSSRRAKQSGISMLNNLIKKVIEMLLDKDKHNQWFRDPVERRIAPHYYNYITNPICLKQMKHKANRDEYTSVENFLADLELMKNNAVQFNGPHNPISMEAANLEQQGTDMMYGKNDQHFKKQMEEAQEKIMVEQFM